MEFKQRFTDVANEYLVLVEDHAQGVNILDIRTKHVTAVRSGAAIAVALEHMQNRTISLAELEQCNLIFKAMVPKSNKRRRGAYGYHHKNPDQPVPILIDEFFLILAAMPKERKALQSMVIATLDIQAAIRERVARGSHDLIAAMITASILRP